MLNITHTIQNKIHLALYGYRQGEFLPCYSAGEMINRNEFIAYKAKRCGIHTYRFAYSVIAATLVLTIVILRHIVMPRVNA
jgi:hypothetical protein